MKSLQKKNYNIALILAAGGSSTRLGIGKKKEFLSMKSRLYAKNAQGTVLSCAAEAFLQTFSLPSSRLKLTEIVITVPKGQEQEGKEALLASENVRETIKKQQINLVIIPGGKTRQQSVFEALKAVNNKSIDVVFIHDGARPFITPDSIQKTAHAVLKHGAAVPAIQPTDTQKEIDENGKIIRHLTRAHLAAVQTPQAFFYRDLLEAHKKADGEKCEYTDDTEIWGNYCGDVFICDGSPENIKITYADDLKKIKSHREQKNMIRCGLGYDLHKLAEKRSLMIGGIEIPSELGEVGHSDGDALLHAITDALLGAAGLGDIGEFFPPSDPHYKDADSAKLLKTAWNCIQEKGWVLENLDCVIALQKPKFLPYRKEVQARIAEILKCDITQVFVKAKTGEKLGIVGTSQAIEVWASCLLSK